MAVPASGALSLRGIMREIKTNNYNSGNSYFGVSLHSLSTGGQGTINTANASSDRPNGSAPHQMSEFYNYDHDKVTLTSFLANPSSPSGLSVCGNEQDTTYYHDGSGAAPVVGDTIYTDSNGSSEAGEGYLQTSGGGGIVINASSEVSGTYVCEGKK
tara:strand:- start:734 stop:1204 length:471 start_codon:yes stop_codon:yes gene_type:complete